MLEGTKVSLIFLILIEKSGEIDQAVTCQTLGMKVSLQTPCSGFCAAHTIIVYSHDYCLRSVYFDSLTYRLMRKGN